MDFSLSTLGFADSTLMLGMCSTSRSNKRRQLSPPSCYSLPNKEINNSIDDERATAINTKTNSLTNKHRDSLLLHYLMHITGFSQPENTNISCQRSHKIFYDDDSVVKFEIDDDTASTVSMSTSSEDSNCLEDESTKDSSSSQKKRVSFASTLVTEVYTRPRTTQDEKYYLHYSEHEYMDFKISYATGKDRTRKVGFALDLVSEVEYVPARSEASRADLYYSEMELQCFLDEFVQSLNSS